MERKYSKATLEKRLTRLEEDGGINMIEQLHEHAIIDSNSSCYGMSAPDNFEIMEKINELIDEVNRLKKKLGEE